MGVDLSKLDTETRNPLTMNLDQMSALEIAEVMNREDARIAPAIHEVLPQVAATINMAAEALQAGGRIIYLGAGTSGRLGVLDASECLPTFGVPKGTVIGLIAGGEEAIVNAVEGAEDSETEAADELDELGVNKNDLVVGLAASGRTPYVKFGLRHARSKGAHTAAIACSHSSEIGQEADVAIEAVPGPEVLTGSTRLKSGTTQKLILNMISTGAMVLTGKVYQNLMVDVVQSNAKLRVRAEGIVMSATGVDREVARESIDAAGGSVKVAVTSILAGCDVEAARQLLDENGGHVRAALVAYGATNKETEGKQ